MAQDFDEDAERQRLSDAEDKIINALKNNDMTAFFINDDLYIFGVYRNVKIFKGKVASGFEFFIKLIQDGQSHTRLILTPAEKKMVREAINTYIPRYVGFTYRPSDNRVEEINGHKYYNTFQPSFYAKHPLEPPYSFPIIDNFLNVFMQPKEREWFLHRLAHTVQKPDIRIPTLILLTGMQGSGKDTLKTIIERTIGEQNLAYLDQNSLEGQFNSFIGKSQVVFCNEIQAGFKNEEKVLSILKHYATNKKIQINEKHIPHYTANNYALWILATNSHRFRPADCNDRRYSIFFNGNKLDTVMKKEDFERLMDLIQSLDHENEMHSEFHNFYWYLRNFEVDTNLITFPLNTEYKEQMINAKLGNNIEWSVMYDAMKEIIEEDKQSKTLLNYDIKLMKDCGAVYIKPKVIIDIIMSKKKALHELDEGKYRIEYNGIKYFLIGNHWFLDHTKKGKIVNNKTMRVLQVNEKRIIDLIEGKDIERQDNEEGE